MHLVPTVRSWTRRLVVGAILLAAFYLLAANLFLLPSVGPSLISRRPERFRLGWQSAWSVWPGEVRFRGLEIRGHQPRVRWWITAEQGTARIDLAALLRREVRIEHLRAGGVRSQTERILLGAPASSRPTSTAAPRRPPWTVRLERVELDGVRELGYGPLLLQGDGRIAGSFRIVLRREVALGDTKLVLPSARLLVRGREAARDVRVGAALRLGPYSPRQHRGIAGFDFLSGHLTANGKVAELPILERISPAKAEPNAPKEPGTLVLDLQVEKGTLVSGSRLRFALPGEGGARLGLSGEVAGERLVLAAETAGLALRRRDGTPFLAADEARLTAATSELRLSRLAREVRTLRTLRPLQTPSPLRGDVEATGLRLRTAGRSMAAEIAAERSRGRIDLVALLSRRLALDDLQAEGVTVQVERAERPVALPAGERQPWTVEIGRARIDRLREVRTGPFRLDGAGRLTGGLSWNGNQLEVRESVLELRKARISRGREELARALDARLAGRIDPCVLQRPSAPLSRSAGEGPGVGDCASFTLRAQAKIHRLRSLPAIGKGGPLRADLRIERGSLRPGSFLELGSRKGGSSVIAVVEGGAGGKAPRLAAEVRGLALGGGEGRPPVAWVAAARASVPLDDLRLGRLLAAVRAVPDGGVPPAADLEATGLRMGASGERVAWSLALERASGRIDLRALARREAVVSAVRGSEARLAVRRSDPGERPVASPGAPPWSMRITDVRITGVREAAFGPNRLLGNGRIEGSLAASLRGGESSFRLDRLALSFDSARIESDGKSVARGVTVLTDLRIAPFTPGELRGARLFRLISGTLAVGGEISSLGFLRPYFRRAPWLVLDGRGHLSADVRLVEGRLLPGTRLTIHPAEVQAEYLLSRAAGTAKVEGMVVTGPGEPHLVLAVDFGRFRITSRDQTGAPPHLVGEGMQLSVTSSDLDLAAPGSKNMLARIVLPEAEVRDLAFYNGYLPEGSGVSILQGTGRLGFDLSMETARQTAHGELTLRSEAVRVQFEDLELAGALSLRSRLTSPDLRTRRFGLDGTSLSLQKVALRHVAPDAGPRSGPRSASDWWAEIVLERGSMEWTRPLTLSSTVRLEMKEAGFLLSLLSRRKPYLAWFGNRLRRTPLTARGELQLAQGAIEVDPLEVRGGHFDIRSRLRLTRERKHGHLFVRWRRLALGVDLEGRERSYRLIRPLKWFNAQSLEDTPAAAALPSRGPDRPAGTAAPGGARSTARVRPGRPAGGGPPDRPRDRNKPGPSPPPRRPAADRGG